jgi:hypothetical protein
MTNALHSEPGKTQRTAPRARPFAGAPGGRSTEVTYTLKVISSAGEGADGGGLRTVLFQRISDGEAIEISAETDAPNLLSKLPEFVEAALEIQRALGATSHHEETAPPGGTLVLAEESRRLRFLTGDHEGVRTRRDLEQQASFREAMIARDIAAEALRSALGRRRRVEIDALLFLHETPAALCESMDRIAAYIDRGLKDSKDAALLLACDIDAAYALSLRRRAAALRDLESTPPATPEDEPKKRGLLRLIGTAYRAIRAEASLAAKGLS